MMKTIPRIGLFVAFATVMLVLTARPSAADEPPAAAPAAAPAAPAAPRLPPPLRRRPRRDGRSGREVAGSRGLHQQRGAQGADHHPGPGPQRLDDDLAALVLFMTLPGLALFYGGLVRRKNVLSVLAQCLGCAGLVTILWWAVGYSLVFAPGIAVPRRARSSRCLKGVDVGAQHRLRRTGCRRTCSRCTS